MVAAKQLFGSMWWRMAVAGAGLVTASFEPMHAQIKWMQSPNGEFVLSPISNSPRDSALPQKLTIADLPKNMYPSRIPHFTVKPDQTIIWDATGWCIEAAGNTDGAEVRINRCTGGPAQLWDCLPQTKQIRLKGTNSCLHVNDEAGLNGAPVELRACDGVASWDFSDSEPLLERTSLSYTRHALIALLSITALGLSLGAWRWKQLAKANHTIASLPSDMDEGGVSLSDPLAGHQGSRSSILEMDSRQQKMVPTVMTMAPSQVKPKKAQRTPTPEMAQRIPHFSDPKSFGLGTILVNDEDDDISKGLKQEDFGMGLVSRPTVQNSNSHLKFPHFEDRRAFGVTPIMVDEIPLEDRFAARSPDSEDGNWLPMEPTTATDVANMAASAVATPLPIDIEGEDDDDSPLKNKIAAISPVSEDVDGQPLIPMDPITAADVASMGASAVATPSPIDIENEDDDEDEDLECAVVDPADTKVVADAGDVGDFPEGQDLDELFDVLMAPPSLGVLDPSTVRFTGRTKRRGDVHRDGDWHGSVHLWCFVRREEELDVLMQKRALTKDTNPGCWDVSVAGHIGAGGTPLDTLVREAEEELGLDVSPESLKHVFTIAGESTGTTENHGPFINREVNYVYMCEIAKGDVDNLRFATGEVEGLRLQPLSLLLCQMRDRDEAFVYRSGPYQKALKRHSTQVFT